MRSGLVFFLFLLAGPSVEGAALGDTMPETLIDFTPSDSTAWTAVNDGVMGGVSRSGMQRTEDGTGVFAGVLSLENGGGFASVRARVGPRDLSRYAGIEIRVRGDGRTYQLRLRTDDAVDGVAYRIEFATENGKWITTRLPFEAFLPSFRGRILDDAPPLDPSRIHQLALMLADGKPGEFSLEIDFARTWEVAEAQVSVTTVSHVDLERYAGVWYEIAKIPNRFQKKCIRGTRAEYSLREDGRIGVRNYCVEADGRQGQADGVAKIVDPATHAKLKVSFVSFLGWRPFWGDYWILGLDPEYRWAIVGTPDRKYGWVLGRTPTLDAETREGIFAILERNGYERGAFEISPP